MYKMEVLRDVDSRTRPLFKVTGDNGEEVSDKAILSNLFCTFHLSLYVLFSITILFSFGEVMPYLPEVCIYCFIFQISW